jgi:excisionase family DNA binding protein
MSVATLPTFSPVSDVAKRAGLSEWTIRQEIKRGNLRARRIGRCVRIVDEDEARWVRGTDAGEAS